LFQYDAEHYDEKDLVEITEAASIKDQSGVSWLSLDCVQHGDLIEKIGNYFDIHPLVLEDIQTTSQRPKMEAYDHYIYVVCNMLAYDNDNKCTFGRQLSIILTSNCVISLEENTSGSFDILRKRLRNNDSLLRKKKADYLAYRLIDTVVDHYFAILEIVGAEIEDLEEQLINEPTKEMLHAIHRLKRELLYIRKLVWPMRDVISEFRREENTLIADATNIYLRDVHDHIVQVMDTVGNFREMVSAMLDIYLSLVSNKMNEVMKVLTIMASIFIPLTFLAGLYGMNFKYMPELDWPWGYPMVWVLSVVIAVAMLLFFKAKRWL